MKNRILALSVLAAVAAAPITAPRNAHALVGGALVFAGGAGVPLMVAGGVMAGGGAAFGAYSCRTQATKPVGELLECMIFGSVGFGIAIIGLVLLDGNTDLAFGELTAEDGAKLGVSPRQIEHYNSELDEINAIRQTIQADVLATAAEGKEVASDEVSASWNSYRDFVSPEAFNALEKVSANIAAELRNQPQ